MKRFRKGMLLASLVWSALGFAQVDITDTLLTNASFDVSADFTVSDSEQLTSGTNYDVTGWDKTVPDNTLSAVFAYGTASTFNGENFDIPTSGYDGTSSACLVINTSWGNTLTYTQAVTLPKGRYSMVYAVNNRSNKAFSASAFGFVSDEGTATYSSVTYFAEDEWTVDTLTFDLDEQTSGSISLGYTASSTYSYDNAALCIDYVKVIYYDTLSALKMDLATAMATAQENIDDAEAPGYYNTAELQSALAAAEALDMETATYSEIQSAYETVKAANDATAAIVEIYSPLLREIKRSQRYADHSDYDGKAAYQTAIDAAWAVFNSTEDQSANIEAAITDLENANLTYQATRESEWLNIKNGALWKDTDGNNVQAHGAGFLQVGDTWYMIGEDRSNSWNPDVNMYSTKDFIHWKFENKIIENGVTHPDLGTDRMIERAKLMYNEKTGKYVVWCHWEASNYGASEAAVFYCDSVNGDYTFHWGGRPFGIKSRDCNVFVDEDGTAYFISTTSENTNLGLFQLSDDYLSVVSHTLLFEYGYREAPAIVKIDDTYFMITSGLDGWSPNQAKVCTSTDLKSGWSDLTSIGNAITFDTQAASILPIQGTEGTSYLYVGDRWQDPDLPESKTIIFPISFSGTTCTFEYSAQFDVNFATGEVRESDENYLDKSGWSVANFSSQETSSEYTPATYAIDGSASTFWHTNYSGSTGGYPHYLDVDMGASYEVSGFLAIPRMDGSTSGLVREFMFYTSEDGVTWDAATGGEWLPYGAEVYFTPRQARYFRFASPSGSYISLAEIEMLQNTPSYEEFPIQSYYQSAPDAAWEISQDITVSQGDSVILGPGTDYIGYYAWVTPDSTIAYGSQYDLSNIAVSDSGTYSIFFLDAYNNTSTLNVHVTVEANIGYNLNKLLVAIDKAKAVYMDTLEYASELQEVITDAETLYASGSEATVAGIDAQIDSLKAAITAYVNTQIETAQDKTSTITKNKTFITTTASGWDGTLSGVGYGVAEFYSTTFSFSQTLEDLDNGLYLFGVQAFYRAGSNDGGKGYENANEPLLAKFFANDDTIDVASVYEVPYTGTGTLNGYCNSLYGANVLFRADDANFSNWILVEVTDGTLNIGLEKTETVSSDWCAFNNFKLYYLEPEVTAVGDISSDAKVEVSRRYFNLQGKLVRKPTANGIYIVEKTYKDGSVEADKIIIMQ